MYAIFETGGRQYQAEPGKIIRVEKIPGVVGDKVSLGQVLLVADGEQIQVGQPLVQDVAVQARIVEQGRYRKVLTFKHKRRKDYRKTIGHRQPFTGILVEGIGAAAEAAATTEA